MRIFAWLYWAAPEWSQGQGEGDLGTKSCAYTHTHIHTCIRQPAFIPSLGAWEENGSTSKTPIA